MKEIDCRLGDLKNTFENTKLDEGKRFRGKNRHANN